MLVPLALAYCSKIMRHSIRPAGTGGPAFCWRRVTCTPASKTDPSGGGLTGDSPSQPSGHANLNPAPHAESVSKMKVVKSTQRRQLSNSMPAAPPPPVAMPRQHADSLASASSAAAGASSSSALHPSDQAAAIDTRGGGPSPDRDASNDVAKPQEEPSVAKPRRGRPPSSGAPAVGLPPAAVLDDPKKLRKPAAALASGPAAAAAGPPPTVQPDVARKSNFCLALEASLQRLEAVWTRAAAVVLGHTTAPYNWARAEAAQAAAEKAAAARAAKAKIEALLQRLEARLPRAAAVVPDRTTAPYNWAKAEAAQAAKPKAASAGPLMPPAVAVGAVSTKRRKSAATLAAEAAAATSSSLSSFSLLERQQRLQRLPCLLHRSRDDGHGCAHGQDPGHCRGGCADRKVYLNLSANLTRIFLP